MFLAAVISIFFLVVRGSTDLIPSADTTPTLESFLGTLTKNRLLRAASLCKIIYKLPERTGNGDLTRILLNAGLIGDYDKVIMQGFRHGNQLGSIVIKAGEKKNHFVLVFSGTESRADWVSDVLAIPTPENLLGHVNAMFKSLSPHSLHIRRKKKEEAHDKEVDVHLGYKRTNKSFLKHLLNGLAPYVQRHKAVKFEIYGHSMGGALASHTAYRIRKKLPGKLDIPEKLVAVEVVTFAAAGMFQTEDLAAADSVIGATHSMVHFVRKNDFARELSALAGFSNPGHYIFLDNFVQGEGSVVDYLHHIASFEETPAEILERIKKEAENHSMQNYIQTIKNGFIMS